MKNGFVIFLAAFAVLFASWSGFVLGPQLQLGRMKQVSILNSSDVYPVTRPGEANQGLSVYRANGCAACHTEQVQQTGVACDVVITDFGKNKEAVHKAIIEANYNAASEVKNSSLQPDLHYSGPKLATNFLESSAPLTFLHNVSESIAEAAAAKIAAAGGKTETHIVATGPDISRGWGLRHSVAEDFLYDNPVQLGSLRIGPDLADVGRRLPDANWQLLHLYAPRSVVKDSAMPPFRYLFETRKKINGEFSPDALNLPKEFAPAADYEVVPTEDAKKLVAYLLSLHADVPLYDAPFTPPAVSTNAPGTNAPAK